MICDGTLYSAWCRLGYLGPEYGRVKYECLSRYWSLLLCWKVAQHTQLNCICIECNCDSYVFLELLLNARFHYHNKEYTWGLSLHFITNQIFWGGTSAHAQLSCYSSVPCQLSLSAYLISFQLASVSRLDCKPCWCDGGGALKHHTWEPY
jgi:hypothetical protein